MSKNTASYDKKYLADLLKTIYEFTKPGIDTSESYRCQRILGGSGTRVSFSSDKGNYVGIVPEGRGPTLTIYNDGVDAYEEFVDEVLKDYEMRNVVGANAIAQQLAALMRSTDGSLPGGNLEVIVRNEILKPLRADIQDWVTFVPVVNLIVQVLLVLGNVELVSADSVKNQTRDFFHDYRFAGDDKTQSDQKEGILKQVNDCCNTVQAFAKVKLHTHHNKTDDVAAADALIALNILRSCTHLLYSHDKRTLIGLPTEVFKSLWKSISLGQDEDRPFHLQLESKGYLIPFILNQSTIDHLKDKCHLGLVQEILDKHVDNRNPLEIAIIQAFQAMGRAIVAPTKDLFFLGCVIALERMLIADEEITETQLWAGRLALALSEEVSNRHQIIHRAKILYGLRSKMVHAAYSGISDSDALLIEDWAINVILGTLGKHKMFTTHKDFCKAIDPSERGLSVVRNI